MSPICLQEPLKITNPAFTAGSDFGGGVVRSGFEPEQAEPKSAVLPLHHRTAHFEAAKLTKKPFYQTFYWLLDIYFTDSHPSAVIRMLFSVISLS